ncbi:MAG: FtsX-like permease family protein [Vicinamibacterales bacterium]
MPGVDVAAFSSGSAPLGGGYSRTRFTLPGQPNSTDPDDSPDIKHIAGDYFRAVGVPLLRGRAFTDADLAKGAVPVVIINDIAADRFFKGKDPIGTMVDTNGSRTIVGVARASRLGGPESTLRPEVYLPMTVSRAFCGWLYLRTSRDPAILSNDARALVRAELPNVIVPEAQTMRSLYDRLVVQRRFNMIMLALFGGLAMMIAAVGVYGVMAYTVEQRTAEIGVRMALGAQPGQVLRMILSRATICMSMGIGIGVTAGWFLARLVGAFLFQVESHDPIVYVGASLVLIAAGLVAAFLPARRASKVDPVSALR